MKISMLVRLEGLVRTVRLKGHAIASKVVTGTQRQKRNLAVRPAVGGKADERRRT